MCLADLIQVCFFVLLVNLFFFFRFFSVAMYINSWFIFVAT